MGEIFISYTSKDLDIATKVYESLIDSDFTCWFAPNDVPPGGDYASRITEALEKVRYVLVLVSKDSGLSDHVHREVTIAAKNNKIIIPFRIDSFPLSDWMSYYFSTLNWVESNEEQIEESIASLIEKIKGMDSLDQNENTEVKSHYGKSIQVVKGSKGTAKSHSYIYQIKKQELARTSSVHIHFPRFEAAKSALKENRILFLQSEMPTGKYTSAIALLNSIRINEFFQVFPNLSAEELTQLPFQKNAGYIIDTISADTLNGLNDFSQRRLMENLQNTDSYLVITTKVAPEAGFGQMIRHEAPADVHKLIHNHLNLLHLTDTEHKQLVQLIREIDLENQLTADFLPRDAEELVLKLFSIIKGEMTTEEFLSSLNSNVKKRVEGWFETNRELDQYALILALSIFNESQATFVTERTTGLKELLLSQSQQESAPVQGALFETSFLRQLQEINAEAYTGFINTNTGKLPDQFVRFKTKEDATAILLHVWKNYPQLKELLLDYLEVLVAGEHKYTNEKVISVLAELAKVDPLTINNRIIQAWANHKDVYYRVLSINLLLKMAQYKENLVFIDKLVNYWASLRNNSRLQWTAAAVYGTAIGIYLFPNSFINLGAIYRANSKHLGDVVYESMKYLYEYGKQDHAYLLSVPYMFQTWLETNQTPDQKHQMLQLYYSLLLSSDRTSLLVLLSDKEIKHELLPYWIAEGLRHWKLRETARRTFKKFFMNSHGFPTLHEPLKIFTFALIIKGRPDLKDEINRILLEILKEPYKEAAVPIVKKILQVERK